MDAGLDNRICVGSETSETSDYSSDCPSLARIDAPCELDFRDISFEVATKDGRKLKILQNVSGRCRTGRLTALMGASGAGKSTLVRCFPCQILALCEGDRMSPFCHLLQTRRVRR